MVRRARTHIFCLLRDERGFQLTELLVAIPMALLVIGGAFAIYDVTVREQTRTDSRALGLINEKNGLERMSRDMRQAYSGWVWVGSLDIAGFAPGASGNKLFELKCTDAACSSFVLITYDCSASSQCTRSQSDQPGVVDTVIANVDTSGVVFTRSSSIPSNYVTVTVPVNVKNMSQPITLNDGFDLRSAPGSL